LENAKGEKMGFTFDDLSNRVIAAAIQVHKLLGPGFLESVYEQALRIELEERNIKAQAQKSIEVLYNGRVVGNHVLDLLVEDQLVVELKAVSKLENIHYAQLRSYLNATCTKVGLLMNFNAPTLVVRRVVRHFEPTKVLA